MTVAVPALAFWIATAAIVFVAVAVLMLIGYLIAAVRVFLRLAAAVERQGERLRESFGHVRRAGKIVGALFDI